MCSILLPINPEHVKNILNGCKKYEYRKIKCQRENISRMIIYATAPVMKVLGEASIEDIIVDDPESVWDQTKDFSGIEKRFFDRYFAGKKTAVAFKLGDVKEYREPVSLESLGINYTPQSFVYVE
jgi:predicted transcriptional regulator